MPQENRSISAIARDIARNWSKVNYAAVPYLDAMYSLDSIDDNYYLDSAREIVARFLCNAGSFRGPEARRIKAELKAMLR